MNVWDELLDRQFDFFRKYIISWRQLLAVTLDVFLLAIVLWILVCLAQKSGNRIFWRILHWGAIIGLLLSMNRLRFLHVAISMRASIAGQPAVLRISLTVLGAAAGIGLLWMWQKSSARVTARLLTILSPALPLLVGSAAWGIYSAPPDGRLPDKPPLPALPQKAQAPHVIWMLFDEWDQALTFADRPAGLALPEIDRFRSQSFHSNRAYPPAPHTWLSVPSLIAGKTFINADPGGANELFLIYDNTAPRERLSAQQTIFSEAVRERFNVGISGFYLPYCRFFGATTCAWYPMEVDQPAEWIDPTRVSLGNFMVRAAKRLVATLPLAKRLGIPRMIGEGIFLNAAGSVSTYRQLHESAFSSIADPRLNMVFVHWNVPHPPAYFDSARDDFSTNRTRTYADNLKLLDRTVRDVRLTLEKAGIWDSSTILLSSDHPLRRRLWEQMHPQVVPSLLNHPQTSEVPFLLKMAGQKQGFSYDAAMQTIVSKDLLLAILRGEITDAGQVAAWLHQNPPRQ